MPFPPALSAAAQEEPKAVAQDQFFSGIVTEISEDRITVSRTVLGKNSSTRTFLITPDTRVEGSPMKVRSRVTVRYTTSEEGDVAVHIIVRSSQKK